MTAFAITAAWDVWDDWDVRRAGVVLVVLVMLAGCGPSPAKPPSARVERAPPPAPRSAEAPPSAPEEPSPDEPLPPYAPRPIVPAPPSVPTPPPTPTPTPTPRPTPTRAEEKACAARGGKIEPVCLGGELECVLRYRDAGKRCTDTKDCLGECLYEGEKPIPAKPVGACQRTSDPCGCKAPIVNGRVEDAFCVD